MLRKPLVLALAAIMLISVGHVVVAGRNGHENNGGQGGIRSEEQRQRALEQIQTAEEMMAQADNLINSLSYGPPHAAVVLLDQAKKHLANAREAYEEGKYEEAYGLANSAEMLARNAIRKLEGVEGGGKAEEEPPAEENVEPPPIEENVGQPPSEENVEPPMEQEMPTLPENEVLPQPENIPYPDLWLPQGVGPNRDGITIYIEVTDNISGADWVYIHWTSPSGAQGGFYMLLNETPEEVRDTTIIIPKYFETGTWQITSVEVYGSIVHRVCISPNMIGPWGEYLIFHVDVIHDISRIGSVEVQLHAPSGGQDGFFFGLRNETVDSVRNASTTWCSENGTWRASYVGVYDKV